jgi:hypothetical protein
MHTHLASPAAASGDPLLLPRSLLLYALNVYIYQVIRETSYLHFLLASPSHSNWLWKSTRRSL